MKTEKQRAWFFVIPVVVLVAFNALVPLMTVVNYSVQETFGNNIFLWSGVRWFEEILTAERFHIALGRQLMFTGIILLIEVPLGIAIALCMPKKGVWASLCLVLMALPLLIPWNVVGAMWNIYSLPDIGLLGYTLNAIGFDYNMTQSPFAAWFTMIMMDVWHWTSLVALLAYAGLSSIPEAYYQAARIDGARPWAVFRHIQLPQDEPGADHRRAAALHGQLHDLHRALRSDGRRTGQLDDVALHRSCETRARPVRSWSGGGDVADLLPDHASGLMGVLHRDDPARR